MDKPSNKTYWRSPSSPGGVKDEPSHLDVFSQPGEQGNPLSRRSFLSLMGASLALAGLAGCRRPVEKIIPFVTPPEERIPGVPEIFATTMSMGTESIGILVENHDGRPTKIDGNPLHPGSRGASNLFIQAAILGLYDPDRSKSVKQAGADKNWEDFVLFWQRKLSQLETTEGAGLAILSEGYASPTLSQLRNELLEHLPGARWVVYDPVSDENIVDGLELITGRAYQPIHDFEKSMVVLALDADFLQLESRNIANSKGFSSLRRVDSPEDPMNRLYVVESGFTVTGSMSDHRLALPSSQLSAFALALAGELKRQGLQLPIQNEIPKSKIQIDGEWVQALAGDLLDHRGEAVILAGRGQPPHLHALVHMLNSALGNVGKTVRYRRVDRNEIPDSSQLAALVEDLNKGTVDTLVMLGGNPVYNAPAELDFGAAMSKAASSIHLASHLDETSRSASWHIPKAHFLEEWGDALSAESAYSIVQPQISPLFGAVSSLELAILLARGRPGSAYDEVRATWSRMQPGDDFELSWKRLLKDGVRQSGRTELEAPGIKREKVQEVIRLNADVPVVGETSPELVLGASNSTYDGRFSNNSWLQELPDPITKLVWDNAVLMNRKTAQAFGVQDGSRVEISHSGRSVIAPVWITPGRADYSLSLALGYGREHCGEVGSGVGVNAYGIRTMGNEYILPGIRISKAAGKYNLVSTQDHHGLDPEKLAAEAIQKRLPVLIREATLTEYQHQPDFAREYEEHPPLVSMWEERDYDEGYQWGMTIDLNVCTGCNTCTIACQSENNIPVVGKREVSRGREMHWLRMDRYFSGSEEAPEMVHQPLGCQHCENAPCEQVCPVVATAHDSEGLNMMTYNRCVGTRYCANNCPYKVRRFNFFNYTKDLPDLVQMVMNPDVTIRSRGVMEKCTFCVQRISQARIAAKKENREIRDGEIRTACQQSCPADAIVFGNINDPDSRISRLKQNNRGYALLGELNTKPRTTYLAKLRNPNPALKS